MGYRIDVRHVGHESLAVDTHWRMHCTWNLCWHPGNTCTPQLLRRPGRTSTLPASQSEAGSSPNPSKNRRAGRWGPLTGLIGGNGYGEQKQQHNSIPLSSLRPSPAFTHTSHHAERPLRCVACARVAAVVAHLFLRCLTSGNDKLVQIIVRCASRGSSNCICKAFHSTVTLV